MVLFFSKTTEAIKSIPPQSVVSLLLPFKSSLTNDIEEPKHEQADEYDHFNEPVQSQVQEVNSPRIHEDHFHVEQNEKNSNEEILD
jgi:hypothetical protein